MIDKGKASSFFKAKYMENGRRCVLECLTSGKPVLPKGTNLAHAKMLDRYVDITECDTLVLPFQASRGQEPRFKLIRRIYLLHACFSNFTSLLTVGS